MAALRRVSITVAWQPAYWATVIGVAMLVAGFGLILLAWRGAAALLLVPLQVPFGASGGIAGLALVGLGAALLNVQVSRHLAARERARTARVISEATRALGSVRSAQTDGEASSSSTS